MIILGRNELRMNQATMTAVLQDYLERHSYADTPKVTKVTMVTENGCVWFVVDLDGLVEKPPRKVG